MKTKNIIILFILCICFVKKANTQTVFNNVYNDYSHVTVNNTYNGDGFFSILNLMNGNISAFGFNRREDTIQNNIYAVEVNQFGDTIQSLNLNFGDNSKSIALEEIQLSDSSIYLFGYTTDNVYTAQENLRGLIVKLDKDLNYLWHKEDYNLGGRNRMKKTIYNELENVFYVLSYAGVDTSNVYANFDIFLSKIDTQGNLINNWQFGGVDWDLCFDFEMLVDGTFILSGYTYNNTAGAAGVPDLYILNVDTLGNILWEKRYGDPGSDYTEGRKNLYVDEDFMLLVGKYEQINGDDFGWLLKLDMQGDTLWSKKYQKDLEYTKFIGVEKWDDESYIILGISEDTSFFPSSKPQAWLVKIDTLGNIIWDRLVGAYPDEEYSHTYVYDFEFAPDKGILLTGYVINDNIIENGINHRNDAWLAKTDSCGYTAGDIPSPFFVVDSLENTKESGIVFITEQSQDYCTAEIDWGDGSENEFYYAYENNLPLAEKQLQHTYTENGTFTIKTTTLAGEEFRSYEVDVVIQGISVGIEDVVAEEVNISLFPNPTDDYVIVQNQHTPIPSLEGNVPEQFSAHIYDLNGKLVKTINLNPKLYQQKVDVASLNNGVYFVKFTFGNEMIATEKLVIAK